MWQRIKAQRIKAFLLIFIFVFSFISFINIPPSYDEQAQMINTMPSLVTMDVNLKALLMYNKSQKSIIPDVKDLFSRDLQSTSMVYDMHKLNVLSSLILIAIPIAMILIILFLLNTSINAVLLILTIFLCFTVIPVLIL